MKKIDNKRTLDQDIIVLMDQCLTREHSESYLIAIMHKIQARYGYLSEQHMDEVAQYMQIPTSTISGVATFYHFFRLRPTGKFSISVCLGTACFVKGADKILEAFKTELGIDLGETTQDGLFSLENSRCLGVCALAPVVTINERIYSNVSARQVPEMLNKVRFDEEE